MTRLLGCDPRDPALYGQALTHPSYVHEMGLDDSAHNERLEFLGDAVLDLVVARLLFDRLPEHPEGELSRMRAAVVCEPTLARVARRLGLGRLMRLGQGEERSGGRRRPSVLANALEALVGAIYLAEGLQAAFRFVRRSFARELEDAAAWRLREDHKTTLQEAMQREHGVEPAYRLVAEEGPDHRKIFHVEVLVNGREAGRGSGPSKKEAEQAAAADALGRTAQEL